MADPDRKASPDELYEEAAVTYGAALQRLARSYEANPDRVRDLVQEIHLALWRSFEHFAQRCSLRTWVYQVAHNTAASHAIRERRIRARLVSLEDLEALPVQEWSDHAVDRHTALERLHLAGQCLDEGSPHQAHSHPALFERSTTWPMN